MLMLCVMATALVMGSVYGDEEKEVVAPPYYLITVKTDNYILPLLPYDTDGLEPLINKETVEAHYNGHHENYRQKMNYLLSLWREEEPENDLNKEPILNILRRVNEIPEDFREKLKNNLGGFINHAIYWGIMSPNADSMPRRPSEELKKEIEETYESYMAFHVEFSQKAMDLFGSGYVWLVRNHTEKAGKQLSIISTVNQDSPISQGLDPLLVIDVWEHAYYLKHQFKRTRYVTDWWSVVDWECVDKLDKFWINLRNKSKKDEL